MDMKSNTRPNIIVILADDMGYSDIGAFGSEISTPNLDRLANGGVSFTEMYNCARCCPSRASLLTGLYPHQAGVGHMTGNRGVPAYQGYLSRNSVTIAEAMKHGGYATGMSGKWHVGGSYGLYPESWNVAGDEAHPLPRQRGFDRFYGTLTGAGSYYRPHTLMQDDEFIDADDHYYYTDAITDSAVNMIEEFHNDSRPFFLYVAYTAPHWPLHALEENVNKYRKLYQQGWDELRKKRYDNQLQKGIIPKHWPLSERHESASPWENVSEQGWFAERMAVYAAQIDRMDQGIGSIMQKLEELNIFDNTMIMFASDNGGCHEELDNSEWVRQMSYPPRNGSDVHVGNDSRWMPGGENTYMSYGLEWANVSNTPFKMFKHWVHEGGIATPLIMHWPLLEDTDRFVQTPCHFIDIMATCLDAAAIDYPKRYNGNIITPLEGKSLLTIIDGQQEEDRGLYWEHEGNKAVRFGRWKLVCKKGNEWELYDMVIDRTELNDVSQQHPELVSTLKALYEEWAKRCEVDSYM